jgi:hypothetical protein
MFKVISIGAVCLAFSACVTSKPASVPPAPCETVVKMWAGVDAVNGMPQPDGGIVFVKPGVDYVDLFVLVSPLHAPKMLKEIDAGQREKTIGVVKEGFCTHPQNGFAYKTFEFRLTPAKQAASN